MQHTNEREKVEGLKVISIDDNKLVRYLILKSLNVNYRTIWTSAEF